MVTITVCNTCHNFAIKVRGGMCTFCATLAEQHRVNYLAKLRVLIKNQDNRETETP